MNLSIVFYLTIDYPNQHTFFEAVDYLVSKGVATIEIGLPSKNPYMDGQVIADSHAHVLKHGFSKERYIKVMTELNQRYPNINRIVMTYKDVVDEFNLLQESDMYEGIIVPDLLVESHGKAIQLYHDQLTDEQIKFRLEHNQVFAYVMSAYASTGMIIKEKTFHSTINRIRKISDIPINVGFGIKSKDDVVEVNHLGVGAIIGSELLRKIHDMQEFKDYIDMLFE